VQWTKTILTAAFLVATVVLSVLLFASGQAALIETVIAIALIGVMIYASIRFAALTFQQVLMLMVFSVAFSLFFMHFGLGVPWAELPTHFQEAIQQFRGNSEPLMACS